MIIVSKWDKRNNQRIFVKPVYKVLVTINRMNINKAESSPSVKNT